MADYSGLIRDAYQLDLRQYMHGGVRHADIECFAAALEFLGSPLDNASQLEGSRLFALTWGAAV